MRSGNADQPVKKHNRRRRETSALSLGDLRIHKPRLVRIVLVVVFGAAIVCGAYVLADGSGPPVDIPPAAPSTLIATAGDTRVSLSWRASGAHSSVRGYDVYRDRTRIARTTSTRYTDTAVSNGRIYSYYVVAYDPAGRLSQPSNSASATPAASTDNHATSSLSRTLGFTSLALDDEFTGSVGSPPNTSRWGAKTFSGGSDSSAYFNGWSEISLDGKGDLAIRAVRTTNSAGQTVWDTGWIESTAGVTPPLLYEVRAKVARLHGMWSGIWLWHYPYGTTCGGEVNVEQLGRQPYSSNNVAHWCDSSGRSRFVIKLRTTAYVLADGFHIYSIAIYANHIEFYIDGVLYSTISSSETKGHWPFLETTSFNISLNVGSCRSWADCVPRTAPSVANLLVDWVRVYTR